MASDTVVEIFNTNSELDSNFFGFHHGPSRCMFKRYETSLKQCVSSKQLHVSSSKKRKQKEKSLAQPKASVSTVNRNLCIFPDQEVNRSVPWFGTFHLSHAESAPACDPQPIWLFEIHLPTTRTYIHHYIPTWTRTCSGGRSCVAITQILLQQQHCQS